MKPAAITQWIVALAAVGALIVSIFNASQINTVHLSVNSRMDELLDAPRKSSKAEGVKQEKDRSEQIPN